MRSFFIRLFILLGLLSAIHPSLAGTNQWSQIGPRVASLNALVIDPVNPSIIYTARGLNIYKSIDGGSSWSKLSVVPNSTAPACSVTYLAIQRLDGAIYASTCEAIYKSNDGGISWVAANIGIPTFRITKIVPHPTNASVLYFIGNGGLYRTTNGTDLFYISTQASNIIADPVTPSTMFIAGAHGVFKSTDSGATWNLSNTGFPGQGVNDIQVSGGVIYAAPAGYGIYKSVNGGSSWSLANSLNVSKFVIGAGNSTTFYAIGASDGGIYRSIDGGTTWLAASNLAQVVNVLAVNPQNSSALFATTSMGLAKSTDGASTWSYSAPSSGLPLAPARAVGVDAANPYNLYAVALGDYGVSLGSYRSSDKGQNWSSLGLSAGHSVSLISISKNYQGVLYGSAGEISTNFGLDWTGGNYSVITGTPDYISALDAATAPGVLYFAGSVCRYGCMPDIKKSSDNGTSWINVDSGIPSRPTKMISAPSNAETFYVSGTFGVYKTINDGGIWGNYSSGLPPGTVSSIAIDPQNSNILYASIGYSNSVPGGGGVYKSTDGAATWTAVNAGLTNLIVTSLAIDTMNPSNIYAATDGGGVFRSTDGGANWTPVNNGLSGTDSLSVNSIVLDALGQNIFIGTDDGAYSYTFGTESAPPTCTLTASPTSISAGGTSTLSASCSPAATSYVWSTNAGFGSTAASGTVSPAATTTYSVTGSNDSGMGNTASATVTVISKTSQTISFGAAPTVAVGGTGTVSATATSGLAVSFSSTTANICTVSGSTVTGIAAGTCTIAANQAGNASYNAAAQVTQDIRVFVTSTVIDGDEGSGSSATVAGGWAFGNGSGGFIPVTGHQKSPPSLPPGYVFLQDLFDFIAIGGTPGSTATVTLNYSHPLPQGVVYWKYGLQTAGGASSWYQYPNFTISADRKQIILTITDGQIGDDDLTANGTIVDAGGPGVLLSAAGGPFAYITHFNSNYVSVVDVTTNTVVSTVTVGQSPEALAIHPDGSEVYVGNYLSNNVSVIDTETMAQTALTAVGAGPRGLAVSPDGDLLYVANNTSGTVSVIDTTTLAVLVTINVGSKPWGVVVSPDSSKVYVANEGSDSVSVISAASNLVTKTIPVGNMPFGLAISPDGSKVYVANFGDSTVSVISTATDAVSASIAVDDGPFGLALPLDGSRLYVTTNADMVSVINAATNTVVTSIPVGGHPQGISVTPDGSKVIAANYYGNTLSVISTATNTVTATITMANGPVAFGNFIAPSSADATAVEFYHAAINHYFMTASADEAAFLDSNTSWGWTRTGKTFKVWQPSSAPGNASPVCRFYGVFSNGTVGSHFYTADAGECAYVKGRLDWGWGYEGDAFYAVRAIELTVPAYSLCPGGTSPVYRAYNNGMGGAPNHRYMTSQTDVDAMVAQGWVSEGTRFCSAQ